MGTLIWLIALIILILHPLQTLATWTTSSLPYRDRPSHAPLVSYHGEVPAGGRNIPALLPTTPPASHYSTIYHPATPGSNTPAVLAVQAEAPAPISKISPISPISVTIPSDYSRRYNVLLSAAKEWGH